MLSQRISPFLPTLTHLDVPPDDAASVARAKAAAIAERHEVLQKVTSARMGALYLLDFYPEALPALLEYLCLCDEFGPATMAKRLRQARSEKFGPSSAWDPRR